MRKLSLLPTLTLLMSPSPFWRPRGVLGSEAAPPTLAPLPSRSEAGAPAVGLPDRASSCAAPPRLRGDINVASTLPAIAALQPAFAALAIPHVPCCLAFCRPVRSVADSLRMLSPALTCILSAN